jgi:hypothetical protein
MDYIGTDYFVDLACSECARTSRVRYSQLLTSLTSGEIVSCAACGRATNHGWSTVFKAQKLFRQHLERSRVALESARRRPDRSFLG